MQRRLLVSTLAVAVAAVLLLGMPLAFVVGRLRASEATQQLRHDATTLATGLQERVRRRAAAGRRRGRPGRCPTVT